MINTDKTFNNHLIIPNVDKNFVFNIEALVNIGYSIKKWSDCALENNLDIKKQICRIVEIIAQAPSFDNSRTDEHCATAITYMREVSLIKNIKVDFVKDILNLCMCCYQLIQNTAITFVTEKLRNARINDNNETTLIAEHEVLLNQQVLFQSMYCNQIIRKIAIACIKEKLEAASLIATNKLLLKMYETKVWNLLPPKRCLSTIANVEATFSKILKVLQEMKEEIELDNLGINAFNQCNGCGSGSNKF